MTFLITSSGQTSSDPQTWRETVREFWFGRYSRSGGVLDSTGFEQVFQGQVREGGFELTGMNDWVQMYKEEQKGDFVYGFSNDDCQVSKTTNTHFMSPY